MTQPTSGPQRHDYEPGDGTSPMQTDRLCRLCGLTKRAQCHR